LPNKTSHDREPGPKASRSLRSELLFNLGFLAAAALVLALSAAGILPATSADQSGSPWLLGVLVVVDVAIFLVLGNYLLNRLVLAPLAESVQVAQEIAGGDYDRRIPAGRTPEMASLSTALNSLTDTLLQNQEKLADNVRSLDESNRLLHKTQAELVQAEKMASIGRLAAGIAHEIGNPLGALFGYTAVLRKRGAMPDLADGLDREARRIDQIVRGLLDYARPGADPRESVDVNASVGRVADLLREQGHIGKVELELDLESDMPPISAAPHRVDQLFVNLFSNAIAAMEGEGSITVVTRRTRYRPTRTLPARRADDPPGIDYSHLRRMRHGTARESRLQPNRDVVHIVVTDTGPGIDRELIESIFDPFFTTKPPGEGTGLGLAIVASTVSELGGRVEAVSAEGGGATFHLYLPTEEAEA
jgi:signal transduction histidine kinase